MIFTPDSLILGSLQHGTYVHRALFAVSLRPLNIAFSYSTICMYIGIRPVRPSLVRRSQARQGSRGGCDGRRMAAYLKRRI